MTKTTSPETLNPSVIHTLRIEAASAGDTATVRDCDTVLDHGELTDSGRRRAAGIRVRKVLGYALAQE